MLARLANPLGVSTILTLNFENLIEQAFLATQNPLTVYAVGWLPKKLQCEILTRRACSLLSGLQQQRLNAMPSADFRSAPSNLTRFYQ